MNYIVKKGKEGLTLYESYIIITSTTEEIEMTTINKLNKISEKLSEREKRTIANLISRIEYFTEIEDKEKLENCMAEAELWGVA